MPINLNFKRNFLAEMLLGSGQDRLFDSFEHDLLVDTFIAMNRVDDAQYFITVHGRSFPTTTPLAPTKKAGARPTQCDAGSPPLTASFDGLLHTSQSRDEKHR